MSAQTRRPPVSTRHAFALAFDLAFRRDPVHSLIVPLLLRAPWAVALGRLQPQAIHALETGEGSGAIVGLASLALIGDFVVLLVVGAMLRIRARSVYDTPPWIRPASIADGYMLGIRRIPWLFVTELVRNGALALAGSISILPAAFMRLHAETFVSDFVRNVALLIVAFCLSLPTLLLGYRLAVATEAVVLDEHDLAGAFQRSFRLMRGRFERWLELVAASGALVLVVSLGSAAASALLPALAGPPGVVLTLLLVVAVTPVIQYAWTFFYLRLVEVEHPPLEVPPAYAAAPGNGRSAAAPRPEARVEAGDGPEA
jgi:hypothetical protein